MGDGVNHLGDSQILGGQVVAIKFKLMPANPETLLRRYEHDFPEHVKKN
jgi:hypothetical protein